MVALGLILSFVLNVFAASAQSEIINVGKLKYEVINTPSTLSGRPAPLLVIAPAKKYTMTGKIFEQLAEKASKVGFHVVRFNWSFISKNTEPSKDLSGESTDLVNIMNHFSKQPYINKNNVILAAKSFGSLVAMKAAFSKANSFLLLTPNCDDNNTFIKNYTQVLKNNKPTHIIISKDDPYCDVKQIYQAIPQQVKDFVTLHTLYGDHNFILNGPESILNENTAIDSAVNWLNLQIR